MCGRYRLSRPDLLVERYELPGLDELQLAPRYNIAPGQQILAIVADEAGRRLAWLRWGFQPHWARGSRGSTPINARAETIAESRLFRPALLKRRCLIPADGFYEWAAAPGGRKQPYQVQLADGRLFGFAGIATEPTDDQPATCAIITTAANSLMRAIQPRMPVILDPADEALWLDPSVLDLAFLQRCLRAFPAAEILAYPVSARVSSARNDGPDLIEPLANP